MQNISNLSDASLDTTFTPPSAEHWHEAALAGLAPGSTLDALQHCTLDGLAIQALYHESSAATRVPARAGMRDGRGSLCWDNRLCVHNTRDALSANREVQQGLAGGITSAELHVTADTDYDTLLQDVLLDIAPVSLRAGPEHDAAATRFLAHVEQQGTELQDLRCSFAADPLGDLLRGELHAPLNDSLQSMTHFAQTLKSRAPKATAVLVDCTLHHNAGASVAQELQAAIATAALYLSHLLDAGMSVDDARQTLVLQLACDADLLMGVVKLRSLNLLWQNLLAQLGHSGSAEPPPLNLVAETSRRYLSRLDPWNNHLRNITACSAAAMGGASSIIVHPHDQINPLPPSHDAALGKRMARNLPLILERESALTAVSDPLAGSHAVETLTAELSERVTQSLQDMGDTRAWIESLTTGRWQAVLADTQQRRVAQMKADSRIVVGVNRYQAQGSADNTTSQDIPEQTSGVVLHPVRDAESFETLSSAAPGDAP